MPLLGTDRGDALLNQQGPRVLRAPFGGYLVEARGRAGDVISHAIVCPQGQNLADPFEDSDGSPPLDPPGHGPVWRLVVLPMYARNGLLQAARTLEQYPVMARAIAEYERGTTVRS